MDTLLFQQKLDQVCNWTRDEDGFIRVTAWKHTVSPTITYRWSRSFGGFWVIRNESTNEWLDWHGRWRSNPVKNSNYVHAIWFSKKITGMPQATQPRT